MGPWPLALLLCLLGNQRSLFPPGLILQQEFGGLFHPPAQTPLSHRKAEPSPLLLLRKPQFPVHFIASAAAGMGTRLQLPASPGGAPGGSKGPTLTCGKETELFCNCC